MKIVLDSNVLFSALIKESTTREIIIKSDIPFLFPYYIFNELEKHKSYLIKKSQQTEEQFNKLLSILLQNVVIVPNETIKPFGKLAYEIIKDIDPNDTPIIACALVYPNSIIWSDDKALKKQKYVKVCNTQEIILIVNLLEKN